MPRENYSYLSEETKDTLTDNVKAMADGWGKSREYLYQILRSEKDDFFPPFEAMYRGALKGGVSTAEWDRKLAYLRGTVRPERPRTVAEILATKVGDDSSTTQLLLEAIRDGRIDDNEKAQIRKALAAEQRDINEIARLIDSEEAVH